MNKVEHLRREAVDAILLYGDTTAQRCYGAVARRRVGSIDCVFQSYVLAALRSAAKSLETPLANAVVSSREHHRQIHAHAALEVAVIGEQRMHIFPQFSGGEQQKPPSLACSLKHWKFS
ncbi:hypothetical protein ACRAWG_15200 [Methylobacterium sp. P31]